MAYTTIKKPSDYFNTKLYTGNLSTNNITGVGFQPDFCWLKSRTQGGTGYNGNNFFFDNVRGVENFLRSDLSNAEGTLSTSLTSFDSDGFTIGALDNINNSGDSFVSWNWLASNTTASNTDGSITSTVSANTTSGFSIVSYTGTGANATIGHGLNAECKMVIIKNRTDAVDWSVNHQPLCASLGDYTRYLTLNSTSAVSGAGNVAYQNTPFTSSVFNVGTSNTTNGSGDNIIAYCFAEVKGFSKFGSYVGNGNTDGTFVYTGFKPAFIIIKRTDDTREWFMLDNKRDTENPVDKNIYASSSVAENSSERCDFLSNGFKLTTTSGGSNASGANIIYMAFAEEPLVGDNPCTAR